MDRGLREVADTCQYASSAFLCLTKNQLASSISSWEYRFLMPLPRPGRQGMFMKKYCNNCHREIGAICLIIDTAKGRICCKIVYGIVVLTQNARAVLFDSYWPNFS